MGLDHSITVESIKQGPESIVEAREYSFRKVNALQGYFEDNFEEIQNGEEFYFDEEHILKLKKVTDWILKNKDDKDYISKYLPPADGFFYGSSDVDEWYFQDVEHINKVMREIMSTPNRVSYKYWAWW